MSGLPWTVPSTSFESSERFHFTSRLVERTYERLPEKMQKVHYSLQIYEVNPRPQGRPKPYQALNRHSSFGYASKGFYQAELGAGGNTFRWSRGDASVEMPEIDATYPGSSDCTAGSPGRGEQQPNLPSGSMFNGHDLGPLQIVSGIQRIQNPDRPIAVGPRGGETWSRFERSPLTHPPWGMVRIHVTWGLCWIASSFNPWFRWEVPVPFRWISVPSARGYQGMISIQPKPTGIPGPGFPQVWFGRSLWILAGTISS